VSKLKTSCPEGQEVRSHLEKDRLIIVTPFQPLRTGLKASVIFIHFNRAKEGCQQKNFLIAL
jgi:hypothetical protein